MLRGAHRVVRAKPGRVRIYWYSQRGRGGVQLAAFAGATLAEAEAAERAGAKEINARYSEVHKPPPARGFVASMIRDFKASPEWERLAPQTQRLWAPHLDAIDQVFGDTSLAGIQRRGVRALIRTWHAGMAATPRKANVALTVMVRLFEFGKDTELVDRNPAAGIARLEEGPGRAGIVWTQAEFEGVLAHCGPALQRALRLALWTGLRREDLIRLRWDEVDLDARLIRRPTLKSRRHKRIARIEIDDAGMTLLSAFPRSAVQVVTREDGGAYATPGSFSSVLRRPFAKAGVGKHLHDLRGTCVSRYFSEQHTDAEAEIRFGWAEGSGAKMRAIYGDPETIALAAVRRLQERRA